MAESPLLIRDVLNAGRYLLDKAGIPDPRREALALWSDLERRSAGHVMLRSAGGANPILVEIYLERVIPRRVEGMPRAYASECAGFRRLMLECDARALIPRPETEGVIDLALARVRQGTAADIGTGSGALALALRDEGDFDTVFGTDISPAALELARHNGERLQLRVEWREGDLIAPLGDRRVNLLVSNPPYLTEAEYDSLEPSVRNYEPALALVAGSDGMSVTRRLLDQAGAVMAAEGWIVLEVDCRRARQSAEFAAACGWQQVSVLEDLFGRERYVLGQWGSHHDR